MIRKEKGWVIIQLEINCTVWCVIMSSTIVVSRSTVTIRSLLRIQHYIQRSLELVLGSVRLIESDNHRSLEESIIQFGVTNSLGMITPVGYRRLPIEE